jgi:LysM repeat protein
MAITNSQASKINKMNKAAQDANLGTAFQTLQSKSEKTITGKYTVVSADQTAGYKTINTGITISGFIVQVYRAGILLGSVKVTATTTNLKVETNGSDYVVTTGDVINYIVFAA